MSLQLMNLKKILLALSGILIFCVNSATAEKFKVGVILPLTGNAASYGQQYKAGIDFTLTHTFEFIYEDSKFENTSALSAFKKLVEVDKVNFLLSFGGATCEVLNRAAQERKILHIAAGCNTAKFKNPESYNFRLDVNEELAADRTLSYLMRRQFNRVAFIYVNNSWAETTISYTKRVFEDEGIEILAEIPFEENSLDVRSSLTKLKAIKPPVQLIYFVSLPNLTPNILRQLAEIKFNVPLMSNISVENVELVINAGKMANGILYLAARSNSDAADRFPAFFSKFPNASAFTKWGYDSVLMLTLASQAESPVHYMRNLKKLIGTFTTYSYNESGELLLNYEIREIRRGNFVWKSDV